MSYPVRALIIVVSFALAFVAEASPLFDNDTVFEINLVGPLSSLIEDKKNHDEMDFVLRADGVEHRVEVRLRGNSRLIQCDFPPLRVDFDKEETGTTIFAGQNKLKLTTHCSDKKSAQSNVLEEYAAYRIFNLLSDIGYRVRLVQVTYTDTIERDGENNFTSYGFFIESSPELADRLGGQPVEEAAVYWSSFDHQHAARVFVFQYLIGNTDWSLVANVADEFCCHNGDLFDIGENRYVVPYDFDRSGLVDAGYARPDGSLRISRVTQRLYRGYCVSLDILKDAIRAVAGQQNDILDVIRQTPGLSEKEAEDALEFLSEFFEKTDKVDKLAHSFERQCL